MCRGGPCLLLRKDFNEWLVNNNILLIIHHKFHSSKLGYYNIIKQSPIMIVGISAPANNKPGFTPCVKNLLRIDCPAGLGALAITVSPPPVTALRI